VIFSTTKNEEYATFQLQNLKKEKKGNIYFENANIEQDTLLLLKFTCPDVTCSVECTNGWPELRAHVKKEHKKFICELCSKFKKVFPSEAILYSSEGLKRHLREGDKDDPSFKGHPECGFCQMRFYGLDELYEHCREKHEQCFICQRQGIQNQYYINYESLEEHFGVEHYLCQEPSCKEKKFVVFGSDIDLQAHRVLIY
jgi:hypothetical protein